MTKAVFVDANILVADTIDSAPFHDQAEKALDRLHASNTPIYISRQVLREFAATLTRPQSWGQAVPGEAVAIELARFQKLYRLAEESPASTETLLAFIRDGRAAGRQVHGANIAAVMMANGIKKILTLNGKDFARFGGEIEVVGVA